MPSVRESAASVVVTFITTYPLGAKRVTAHMKQMISNCSYVYEDGRQSSFEALATLVRLLPLPLLEDHAASVFLPMTLRLVSTVWYCSVCVCACVCTCVSIFLPSCLCDSILTSFFLTDCYSLFTLNSNLVSLFLSFTSTFFSPLLLQSSHFLSSMPPPSFPFLPFPSTPLFDHRITSLLHGHSPPPLYVMNR